MQYGYNKTLTVLFNNQIIFQTSIINFSTGLPDYWQNISMMLNITAKTNCLTFQMTGPFDQHGYYIHNVTVRHVLTYENNITVVE